MGRPVSVLVLGSNGQLGRELVELLARDDRDVIAADMATFDIVDRDATVGAICVLRPDVVVNCAAWTDVDGAESDPGRAFRVNALGVRHVADGCRRTGAHLVQLSTDYVFDGELDRPYTEWDTCNPLSVYGRSKRGGELEVDPGWTIVRTSWLFGRHGRNIVKTILRLASEPGELRFVDDQRGCPTSAEDLSPVLARLALGRIPGTFHATNAGPTTWYELARQVLLVAGADPSRVVAISSEALGSPARRPASSVLDNAALGSCGIAPLADHREPLERLVKELTS